MQKFSEEISGTMENEMERKLLMKAGLAVALTLASVAVSRADSLNVTSANPSQNVVQGTTVVTFDESISNPSADTLFLNSDATFTNSLLVSVDDSPFFTNAPFFLDPLASSGPFALFNVDLPASLAPGLYTGTFSIFGGTDAGSSDDLADVNFSVTVKSPVVVTTPEPATLLLLGCGILSILGIAALASDATGRRDVATLRAGLSRQ
jgi:hypothetical protein